MLWREAKTCDVGLHQMGWIGQHEAIPTMGRPIALPNLIDTGMAGGDRWVGSTPCGI